MEIGQWAMLGGAMLLLRAGLGIYLCGLSRSKNALSTLFRSIVETCVGMVTFWAVGEAVWHRSMGEVFCRFPSGDASTLFAAMVCIFGAGLAVGPTIERSRPLVSVIGAGLGGGVIVPLGWRSAWSGRLHALGFVDTAGSGFVHWSAAAAALAGVIFVGSRQGKYNRDGSTNVLLGHHGVLTSIGLLLMFAIWPAYVGWCAILHGGKMAGGTAFDVILAGAAGGVMAMIFTEIRFRKLDVLLVYAGILGGLVAVTGGAGHFSAPHCAAVGAIAGVVTPWLIMRLDLVWKIDDPSGLIAVCAGGGLIGTLAAGFGGAAPFADRLRVVGAQCVGLVAIGVVSFAVSMGVMLVLKATGRLRVSESDEFDGLDLAEHDLNAYPDFQQTTIKSYHTREI
jgi:Amt family ammonium transporter